jgi:hypothetical protein
MIQHNTLINENGQTATVILQNMFGPINNVTENDNLMVGGGYTLYVDNSHAGGPVTNVSITNNHLGQGQYGYVDFTANPVFTGNVDDGAALAATLKTVPIAPNF